MSATSSLRIQIILLLAQLVPLVNSYSSQTLACEIKQMAHRNELTLWKQHSSGVLDNAYAYNNIKDVCNGEKAARSSYTCSECQYPGAPGGYTELSSKLLKYIKSASIRTDNLHVNEIAGACHSCNSKHYDGKAVDIHRLSNHQANTLVNLCNDSGGRGIDEGSHIHCQFP